MSAVTLTPRALYEEVAELLRQRIFAAELEPGSWIDEMRLAEEYGISLQPLPPVSFAKNDVGFVDPTGTDHDTLGRALKKALYNYMHGIGLEEDVRSWFQTSVPKTRVNRRFIEKALAMV
jgi:hypothetical protein